MAGQNRSGRLVSGTWHPDDAEQDCAGRTYQLDVDVGRPLLSNARIHHMAKATIVKEWRTTARWLAVQARVPALPRVSVACWGRYDTRVLPDVDAVAPTLKAVLDGIVDARVLVDDKAPFVQAITYRAPVYDKGCRPALVVVLTDLGRDV